MKLTKGKISKAMHKKNQTLKRYKKNSKKYIKSKTFRRRGAVSLDKMTLKNVKSLIGGANTPPDKDSPLESEKPADVIGKNESNVAPLVSDELLRLPPTEFPRSPTPSATARSKRTL